METICKCCAFNIKDTDGKQKGCFFDRLEKFVKTGISIKDSECGQYKIIDGICNLCFMEDSKFSMEDAAKIAIESTNIKYDIIIEPTLIDDLKNILNKITSLSIKPKKIIFLNHGQLSNFSDLLNKTKILWETTTSIHSKLTIDDAISKIKSDYFAFNVTNYEIFNRANDIINDRFIKFFLIHGDEGNLINLKAFKYFVGNMDNFPDKLINLPEELKIGNMVYAWNDLQS